VNKDIKGAPPRRFRGLALKSPPPGIDRDYMKVPSQSSSYARHSKTNSRRVAAIMCLLWWSIFEQQMVLDGPRVMTGMQIT